MSLQSSKFVQRAKEKISRVRGKHLTDQERDKEAIRLALDLLEGSEKVKSWKEKKRQGQLSKMMLDAKGKAFTTSMADQCFRSHSPKRIADQCVYLLDSFGIPRYLSPFKKVQLSIFRRLAPLFPHLTVPFLKAALRKETSNVIIAAEKKPLQKHMEKRKKERVRLNINHLGEAILGEKEAIRRLDMYLEDLMSPQVEYISIKISTIFSQIHLLAWEESLNVLSDRLKLLYQAAIEHPYENSNGEKVSKFVNLDMEEYKDLQLTKELFMKVLNDPEFLNLSAGIVLQAYLPDSFAIQKELTEWAKQRVLNGGAPIKIRIVKGANLAMEQVESSFRRWPQAPYLTKAEVDANYKKMVCYGCEEENSKAVHLGIATHNLFDVAFAMVVRAENEVEATVVFEMLEGMADHTRKIVQEVSGSILLYCPLATKKDFSSAVAYLIRRLDENTGSENFLRHSFGLKAGSIEWNEQVERFSKACLDIPNVEQEPRRKQNRFDTSPLYEITSPFVNEADTDFSLSINRTWAQKIVREWNKKKIDTIPCVIAGKETFFSSEGKGFDPSYPEAFSYSYALADWPGVDKAIQTAKETESIWQKTPLTERASLLAKAAQKLREQRGDLIGAMMADGGKSFLEADPEISEAIDFAEYYLRSALSIQEEKDITWKPKGTILVAPPWNFPISIPAGGILAALVMGNCVLFKPAPEAVLSGWVLVQVLWKAGISKNVLQFINCEDDPIGSKLIQDPRVNAVVLTGATQTARLFMKMREDLDLSAETGGKNALIITALSDRDLAIKDLIHSAFGHSGQKCSAASLAILEAEVYDDPNFLRQLKDAVESIPVGSPWVLSSKVTPLIRAPGDALQKAFTTLEPGETWLVEPKQSKENPNLWSPGVKLGVKPGSFMHQTECFGPVLSVMRAKNLDHAIELANGTPYGLTSGIHSLDKREIKRWINQIESGNLYINRSTTGAIVQRQPFGGCKASSFGHGIKAGGPSYLYSFIHIEQKSLPIERSSPPQEVDHLIDLCGKTSFSTEDLGLWYGSVCSYAFWAEHFNSFYDLENPKNLSDLVIGEDNALCYVARKKISFRIQKNDILIDVLRVLAALLCANVPCEISWSEGPIDFHSNWMDAFPLFKFAQEQEENFLQRIKKGTIDRVRLLSSPTEELKKISAESGCFLDIGNPLANGRWELLRYKREVAISYDYHRYGNLGMREQEKRNPIF